MIELWEDIPDYEGKYQVSNLGRIRNIQRNNHILKLSDDGKGYKKVKLCKNKKSKLFRVHRLVAQVFIPNPNNLPEVNHIDFNRLNNKYDNLEWCDRQHNMNHSVKGNRFHNKPILCINNDTKIYYNSIEEASEKTGIHRSNIGRCCNKKRKTAGGLKWMFVKGEMFNG